MRFFHSHFVVLAFISAMLLQHTKEVLAEDMPWHLGDKNSQSEQAKSAVNVNGLEPGPHEIVVAIIDAGVLSNHPSLQGKLLNGYDMVSGPKNLRGGRSKNYAPDERDSNCDGKPTNFLNRTHGTEMASLIAGNGEFGVHGINKTARVLPIRLFGSCPIQRQDLMDALAWAAGFPVENAPINLTPAHVINMSFSGGGTVCEPELQNLLRRIKQKGIYIVTAAGNRFGRALLEPANCEDVISVGALDFDNKIPPYSAIDPRISIYAPGGGTQIGISNLLGSKKLRVASFDVNLLGIETPNGVEKGVGTSYSSSLVSGFISLILSWTPELKPDDFLNSITLFSRDVEPPMSCQECKPRGLVIYQKK